MSVSISSDQVAVIAALSAGASESDPRAAATSFWLGNRFRPLRGKGKNCD